MGSNAKFRHLTGGTFMLLAVLMAGCGAGPGVAMAVRDRQDTQNELQLRPVRRHTEFERTQLAYPIGVKVDAAGNAYIADTGNGRIVKLRKDGSSVLTFGRTGSAPGEMNLPS